MRNHFPAFIGAVLLLCLAGTGSCAVAPLWIEHATTGGDLSGVIISADDSTIVAGGAQLICLTRDGQKRWSGWSGTSLAISSDGDYILSSQGKDVRLISSAGSLVWDRSIDITVTKLSMAPNASIIAAAGGGTLRTMTFGGEAIASNSTQAINDIHVMPQADRILVSTTKDIQLQNLKLIQQWSDASGAQDLVAVAPDGSGFVTATNNRIRMYRGNGTRVWDRKFDSGNAVSLAYSHDGSTIVVGMDDSNVQVMNRDGSKLFTANATNWISSVAVSDDGNTIVAGSMDKKVAVYNHAGVRLGTFTAKSAIKFNSVAVTGDGSLIIVVDETAVYGLARSSFTDPAVTPAETVAGFVPEITDEPEPIFTTVASTRKVTPRVSSIPTPYPVETDTPESPLPAIVPVAVISAIILCRSWKKEGI